MNLLVENQTIKTLYRSIAGVRPAVVSRQHRIASIERLRIVSVCAIASFHTHEWFLRSIGVVGFIILYFVADNIYFKKKPLKQFV
ncbi:MAG: hypothetical protein ACYSUX_11005, partial [Planctomycetota bacterium]